MNRWLVLLAFAFLPSQAIGAPVFYVTGPYQGLADSPFDTSGLGTTFFVEDFEDGSLDLPGLTVNQGGPLQTLVVGPGNGAVSVEGGAAGHALKSTNRYTFFSKPPVDMSGLSLEFSPIGGALPTHVGFVLTGFDTAAEVGLRTVVYGPAGELLGTASVGRFELAERPFLGVAAAEGISKIDFDALVIDDEPYFQIDHLQFVVPEPTAGVLIDVGASCFMARRFFGKIRRS